MEVAGAALTRAYYEQVVAPGLNARWPGLPHAAGRLGGGSNVLGYDDEVSRDHDWGLRLSLLVAVEMAERVNDHLELVLPATCAGHPVRFTLTGDPRVRHHVGVETWPPS